jgi:ribosomal protein S18 acetylase RimI-like enzyme
VKRRKKQRKDSARGRLTRRAASGKARRAEKSQEKVRGAPEGDFPGYTCKELSRKTWGEFVKLFSQGNGCDHCWCMHFQRPCGLPQEQRLNRKERSVINRREKKRLVDRGRAHGILVYARREPVGWCQYGPREELPRIDTSRKYRFCAKKAVPGSDGLKLWRITCFAVLRTHRRRGVASRALDAALQAIRAKGGGVVEAYPISRWESYAFGNESTPGTAAMFEKAGFEKVASFGETRFSTHVLMRKILPAAHSSDAYRPLRSFFESS